METLTLTEAAQLLRISRRSLLKLLAAGQLSGAYKTSDATNAAWRIPQSAVDGFKARPRQTQK